ncbi:class I SAM-dependent methyltransferase [Nonomuraea sp. NPDC049480]|uniref:class I SAM-dependent methyltransferase n=1 Tax=Nonomuraea sp. NPDC049480 TaxID=3364353 RepID=UPI003797ACDD
MTTNPASKSGEARFAFGENWRDYVELVDEKRIEAAGRSLAQALGVRDLTGSSFLDIGCGSGLFSLAAHRFGAKVHAFDYDPKSVAASVELRRRFAPDSQWKIEQGSILDVDYTKGLGLHDIVYSWGVLHHTGDMWRAIGATASLVAPGGLLYIALYNDQGIPSRLWWRLKRKYVRSGPAMRNALVLAAGTYFSARTAIGQSIKRRTGTPSESGARYRAMSRRHDLIDWVGGFPFEVAKPDEVFSFFRDRNFELRHLTTCGGSLGCNEYVFRAPSSGESPYEHFIIPQPGK